ncbi:hypothetical protein [Nocardia sp. NPDC052566]|uniref:hypothetical protein n=1 Tax=Nocardia sp. NPDC052566 TaxID=3364330 RepID=UPI0037C79969
MKPGTGFAGVWVCGVVMLCCACEVGASGPTPVSTLPSATGWHQPVARPAKTQGWLRVYRGSVPVDQTHAVQLTAIGDPAVGQHVSAALGRSLYRFDGDGVSPPASTCVGECAGKWPGLLVRRDQVVYAAGVDPQLVGYTQRPDGAYQVTIGGRPVYYFAEDRKAGDVRGHGIDNMWFAVSPSGAKAMAG